MHNVCMCTYLNWTWNASFSGTSVGPQKVTFYCSLFFSIVCLLDPLSVPTILLNNGDETINKTVPAHRVGGKYLLSSIMSVKRDLDRRFSGGL